MRDLWIDFNNVEGDDRVETLLSFADRPITAEPGIVLVVGDDDGTLCKAEVLWVDGDRVGLQLHRDSLVDVVGVVRTASHIG